MRRAFSLIEIISVLAIGGVVAVAGFASVVPMFERSRRAEQASAAVAQIRKMRAHALTVNQGAALEIEPRSGGGIRMTTAVVPRNPGAPQCQGYAGRASSIEVRDYDLLDIVVPRADNTLCFEASAFRLLADDGVSLAPAAAPIDFFLADTTDSLGTVTVAVSGTFGSTFEPDRQEGLTATINVQPVPEPDDPVRFVLTPRELEPELPVFVPPPPPPTTPAGEPEVAALPPPTGEVDAGPPPACTVNADCPQFFECGGGVCHPVNPDCGTNLDCTEDTVCVAGSCVQGCNTSLCISNGCNSFCARADCCTNYGCMCL